MRKPRAGTENKSGLGAGVAGALLFAAISTSAQAEQAKSENFSLTIMGFNIWNNGADSKMWDAEAKKNGTLVYNKTMQDLLLGVAPDVLVMPELYNNSGKTWQGNSVVGAHVKNTLDLLNGQTDKLGTYQKIKDHEAREGSGMVISSGNTEYLAPNTILMKANNGFPDTVIEGRHFNYADEPVNRINQAKEANKLAQSNLVPTILVGDLNAGDISERGLLSVDAQLRLIKKATGNKLYAALAAEYLELADEEKYRAIIQAEYPGKNIDTLSYNQWGAALEKAYKAKIDIGLVDETYPVEHNLPVTMNILKQQHQLIQLDRNREQFKPSEVGDERATWTSDGEEATNTWASWDRANIDHIMVSRPFAKWVEIVDNGKWSGSLSKPALLPNGNSLSDHDPIAQTLRWVGPKLETYKDGDTTKNRVVWGADASGFETKNKEFYLTRNNSRNDVYLGQIADANGNPILKDLTAEEKQTLLNCQTTDTRFAQAVRDYCIDNHNFIGETVISDGGTVVVDEDAALGSASADLRLNDGGLRVAGYSMNKLDRKVVLDGKGWIDVAAAGNNLSVNQAITGTGSLTKRGDGVLTLNAANSYTGGTLVERGGLIVGDADHSNASVLGAVTVRNGGFIGGAGTFGAIHIAADGVLAPGNSIGTLTASGDLVMDAGAVYHLEINPDGTADRVHAAGIASIDGAKLYVEKATGTYAPDSRYTIMTADAGISGTFADLSQNMPFINLGLTYDPMAVYLDVLRNQIAFDAIGETDNQRSVAASVEALGSGNAVYDAVVGQESKEHALNAFNLLSGEIHASARTALVNASADLRNAAQDRLRSAFGDASAQKGAQVAAVKDAPAALWVQSFGTWSENSSNNNAAKLSQTTGGVFAGYDAEVADNARLGALAGYSRTSFDVDDRASSGESDNYHLGLYGGAHWGTTALSGGLAYSWHSVDISRSVRFPDFSEKLSADYDAGTVQAFGELSHKLQTGAAVFEPFANLAYVSVKTDGLTETGGNAALTIHGDTMGTTFTTLGLRAATDVMLGDVKASLTGTLGWQHAFGDTDPVSRASFVSGSAFDISGIPVAQDTALVQAGFDVKASEQASFGISYRGQFGSGYQSNSVNAKLGIKF